MMDKAVLISLFLVAVCVVTPFVVLIICMYFEWARKVLKQ